MSAPAAEREALRALVNPRAKRLHIAAADASVCLCGQRIRDHWQKFQRRRPDDQDCKQCADLARRIIRTENPQR